MLESAFAPLLGQPQAVQLLTAAARHDRLAPAYLFVGPEGVGRALAARCFVQVLCRSSSQWHQGFNPPPPDINHPDVIWVEPTYLIQGKPVTVRQAQEDGLKRKTSPQIRLEQVREIGRFLGRSPLQAPRTVVVMEQAETMAESAANGLLKTLEEPGQATLILIAPSVDSLLPTIVSRCQRIPFHGLQPQELAQVVQHLGAADLLQDAALVQMAAGSPGALLENAQRLQALDPEVLVLVQQLPRSPREALTLAKTLSQTLELDVQLWFLNYLQHCYWQHHAFRGQGLLLQRLETAKQHLRRLVNPRLVWEVLLLELSIAPGSRL